jgi:hypothetical protein
MSARATDQVRATEVRATEERATEMHRISSRHTRAPSA